MHHEWALIFEATPADRAAAVLEEAQAEFDAWIRRPLAPDTTETWEELATRIVSDGWGIDAVDCSVAMRCTVSMVRRARLGEMRHPETGYALPEDLARDALTWAVELDAMGLTLRQVEGITGVSKSRLHRATQARRQRV